MIVCTWNPSFSGDWGTRISLTWETEVAVNWNHTTVLQSGWQSKTPSRKKKRKKKTTQGALAYQLQIKSWPRLTALRRLLKCVIFLMENKIFLKSVILINMGNDLLTFETEVHCFKTVSSKTTVHRALAGHRIHQSINYTPSPINNT